MPVQQQQDNYAHRIAEIAGSLATLFDGKDCIVWIGSGMSIGSGFPDWSTAIEQLCLACIPDKADIRPSDVAEDLLEWAEQCKRANFHEYVKTLERLFGGLPNLIRTSYLLIGACPFRFLVTTNFDVSLERVRTPSVPVLAYPNLALFSAGSRQACVYLHGKARWGNKADASKLVLTKSDFTIAYSNDSSLLPSALDQLVAHHNIIFVGCRLGEQILRDSLRKIKSIHERFTTLPPTRKMILLADEPNQKKAKEEEDMLIPVGIEVLRYPLINKENLGPNESSHRLLDNIWEQVWLKLKDQTDPFRQEGGLPS